MTDYTALASATIGAGKRLKHLYDPKATRQMLTNAHQGKAVLQNLQEVADVCRLDIPGFHPTPLNLVRYMIDKAELSAASQIILEPSAGIGSIADQLVKYPQHMVHCVEVNQTLRGILAKNGHRLVGSDFMDYHLPRYADGEIQFRYDRVLMNPPFENHQDVHHVQHALELLGDGGILVAIMSEHSFFADHKIDQSFRVWLEAWGGESERLPQGMFEQSYRPTGVNTRLVVIRKRE